VPVLAIAQYHSVTLASASPRRETLLRQIGVRSVILPADIDESRRVGEDPVSYVQRLAAEKAVAVWSRDSRQPVLAADTAVVLGEDVFGKPANSAESLSMLQALSGRTHEVLTAVAVRHASGLSAAISRSRVTFRALSLAECERYVATGEPQGKAGGYAIQGLAASFITLLHGSYSAVMGLPLAQTAELLSAAGVQVWNSDEIGA
jgi:septum formation protein